MPHSAIGSRPLHSWMPNSAEALRHQPGTGVRDVDRFALREPARAVGDLDLPRIPDAEARQPHEQQRGNRGDGCQRKRRREAPARRF